MQTHLKLDEVIDALSLLVIESEPETVVELLGTPVTDAEADEVMLVPGREIEGREMGRERDRGSVADADELGGADVMDSEPLTEEDVIEAGNESVVDDGGLRIEESTDDRGSTVELVDDAESVMVAETESVAVAESVVVKSLDVGGGARIDDRPDRIEDRGSTLVLEDEAESVGAVEDAASVDEGASVVDDASVDDASVADAVDVDASVVVATADESELVGWGFRIEDKNEDNGSTLEEDVEEAESVVEIDVGVSVTLADVESVVDADTESVAVALVESVVDADAESVADADDELDDADAESVDEEDAVVELAETKEVVGSG